MTGTSYGIIAPLTNGVTSIVDEARVRRRALVPHPPGPAGDRLVHGADGDPHADEGGRARSARKYDLSALRFLASVGEPLNPEAVVWGQEAFGLPFHDNWWQTETGGIMIANYAAMDIRPGSMGRPLPGVEAAIVRRHGPAACRGRRGTGRAGRAGAAAGLAVDVPRLLERARALSEVLRGWLLPDGRPRAARRRRLLLVRRPRRRRDQDLRPPDRAVRGRERAAWSTRRWPRPA